MRILRLQAENLKRLSVVDITPEGSLVQITGANGSGKSSVLDAIYFALAGKSAIDPMPVRVGSESAVVRLDLGEVKVTRTFHPDGKSELVCEAASGARFPSPQKMLDSLLGSMTFDPLGFSRMKPADQLSELQRVVPVALDVAQSDFDHKGMFDERTAMNRAIKELEARLAALASDGVSLTDEKFALLGLLPEGISVQELAAQVNAAGAANLARERHLALVRSHESRRDQLIAQAESLEAQAVAARMAAARAEDERAKLEASVPALIDAQALTDRLNLFHEWLRIRDAGEVVAKERHRLEAWRQQRDELERRMEANRAEKAAAIAAAPMPVPGLAFGDAGVLLGGIPFEQCSGAEQLRVSVGVAMAANPKLRVLRIKDGSLLDEASLAMIAEAAADRDYQVWIERVDTSGRIGVVMEDGHVRVPAVAVGAPGFEVLNGK